MLDLYEKIDGEDTGDRILTEKFNLLLEVTKLKDMKAPGIDDILT